VTRKRSERWTVQSWLARVRRAGREPDMRLAKVTGPPPAGDSPALAWSGLAEDAGFEPARGCPQHAFQVRGALFSGIRDRSSQAWLWGRRTETNVRERWRLRPKLRPAHTVEVSRIFNDFRPDRGTSTGSPRLSLNVRVCSRRVGYALVRIAASLYPFVLTPMGGAARGVCCASLVLGGGTAHGFVR
jgi:hypothetical protein